FIRMADMILPVKASGSANLRWEEGRSKDMTGDVRFKLEPHEALTADLAIEAERSQFNNALFQKAYVLPAYNETEFRLEGRQMRDLKSHLQTPYTTMDVSGTIDFSGEANLDVVSHTTKIAEIDLLFHHLQAYFSGRPARTQEFWAVRGAADFTGKLDATVWNPFRPRLTGEVIAGDVVYHGVPWERIRADVRFHDKLIEIFDSRLALGNATAQAKATFFLKDSRKGTPNALDLVASVQDFPAVEVAHAFSLDLPIHGTIDATLELKGPFAELEGRADFESPGGDFWGEKWDRGKGTVLFFPDSLGVREVTAHLNGGYIQASGDLVFESDVYNVQFNAENIPLQRLTVLKKAQLEISGVGSATGGGEGTLRKPELHATLDLKNLIYRGEMYGNVAADVNLQPETLFVNATGVARG
ncbi:MAG TPA: hypothetical protein VJ521_00155, partial [Acidobacteriota bacterium]|nr:hypothetical protein [Acidobacteriota bacterium]